MAGNDRIIFMIVEYDRLGSVRMDCVSFWSDSSIEVANLIHSDIFPIYKELNEKWQVRFV